MPEKSQIREFRQLAHAQKLIVGTKLSPIGDYTESLLKSCGRVFGRPFSEAVEANIASRERNCRLVRAKVELGEADAAIVYRSDLKQSKTLRAIPIPENVQPNVRYQFTLLSPNSVAAKKWLAFLASDKAHATLTSFGFEPI